jgi:hypothetical protein
MLDRAVSLLDMASGAYGLLFGDLSSGLYFIFFDGVNLTLLLHLKLNY